MRRNWILYLLLSSQGGGGGGSESKTKLLEFTVADAMYAAKPTIPLFEPVTESESEG